MLAVHLRHRVASPGCSPGSPQRRGARRRPAPLTARSPPGRRPAPGGTSCHGDVSNDTQAAPRACSCSLRRDHAHGARLTAANGDGQMGAGGVPEGRRGATAAQHGRGGGQQRPRDVDLPPRRRRPHSPSEHRGRRRAAGVHTARRCGQVGAGRGGRGRWCRCGLRRHGCPTRSPHATATTPSRPRRSRRRRAASSIRVVAFDWRGRHPLLTHPERGGNARRLPRRSGSRGRPAAARCFEDGPHQRPRVFVAGEHTRSGAWSGTIVVPKSPETADPRR